MTTLATGQIIEVMADDQSPRDSVAGAGGAAASLWGAGTNTVKASTCRMRKQTAIAASSVFSLGAERCMEKWRPDDFSLSDIVASSNIQLVKPVLPLVDQVTILSKGALRLQTTRMM
jgi:hypothetical protein